MLVFTWSDCIGKFWKVREASDPMGEKLEAVSCEEQLKELGVSSPWNSRDSLHPPNL